MFGRFEHADDGRSHTLVLMDDVYFVPQLEQREISFIRTGVRQETEGFTQWKEVQSIQSATLTTRTFDYKRPDLPKEIRADVARLNPVPAQGEVYDYTGAYTWSERDHGDDQAYVRPQAWESQSKRFSGIGSARAVMPGYWFSLTGHPIHDREPEQQREFAILATTWTIRNNLPGMDEVADFAESLRAEVTAAAAAGAGVGVVVKHDDGNAGFFQVEIEAQRRRTPFRSPAEHKKPVMQLQPAIVAGPQGEEIFTDALNRAKVWFPWNRRNGRDEKASCWVRAAFPNAGSKRGGHFPLRAGDEVLIGFVGGDCDRPVILGRMHGGTTPPVWHTNGLLSGLKSKEYGGRGFNQLVFDDATGQNRIHLASTSASSHLHLGYLVEQTKSTRGAYLGSGFDLKSDAHGAIRAGRGLVVSTYPTSAKQPFDVRVATAQLANAESVLEAMSNASVMHQAEGLTPGYQALRAFTDATQSDVPGEASGGRTAGGGTGTANGFQTPIMLMASPAGVTLSTQGSTHVAAEEQVNIVSGASTHAALGKSLIASVADKISLFVQNAGMKLFAAKGKVEIQAQSDNVEFIAQKTIKVAAATATVDVAAKDGVLLTSGGAYIRVKDGNIEIHAPGSVDVKGATRKFDGPTQMPYPLPTFKKSELASRYRHSE